MKPLMELPEEQQALKLTAPGTIELVSSPLPAFRPDQVLIRVARIGLNPVDAKSADLSPSIGATLGADFAGEVVETGSALRRSLKPGDRVFGCIFGNNPLERSNGAFAEYAVACADLLWKIPDNIPFEKASTLGVGLVTVGLGLYHTLGLRLPVLPCEDTIKKQPEHEKSFILVYGAGTATGLLAIQMLRLSGYLPIATCSPHRNALCTELGAVACFDYHSPTCGADIRTYTSNCLLIAFDCIANAESMKICYAAIATAEKDASGDTPAKGRYVALDPFPIRAHTRRSIAPTWILAFTIFDQEISWDRPYQREAKPAHRDWAGKVWFPLVQQLLVEGALRESEIELREGGLASVNYGLQEILHGKVDGRKLVYVV